MFRRYVLYFSTTLFINLIIYVIGQYVVQPPISQAAQPLPTGQFSAEAAKIKRVGQNRWELEEDFYFVDSRGHEWYAPAGTQTDGASIPQAFLSVIGDKFHPDYLDAAVVHDAYCDSNNLHGSSYQTESWEYVHYMFYEALLTNGVPEEKAKIMYTAVYLGGPRWGEEVPMSGTATVQELAFEPIDLEARAAELASMIDWIETENPILADIQSRLNTGE